MLAQYRWLFAAVVLCGGCAANDFEGNSDASVRLDGTTPRSDGALGLPDATSSDADVTPDASLPDADVEPDASIDAEVDAEVDADVMPDADLPLDAVASLTAVRALPDGEVEARVGPVLVTAIKAEVAREGSDAEHPGFFVQASPTGPALYVDVDPATLSPAPHVGDLVRFKVLEMGTLYMQRRATAIEALTVMGTGDVDAGLQNIDAADDLVSALDGYESEAVTGTVTLDAGFVFAGAGYLAANVHTGAVPEAAGTIRLRAPSAVVTEISASGALGAGCTVPFTGVVWRFNGVVQLSVYDAASSIGEIVCPGPQLVGAVATSATEVVVRFDREIDPGSVIAPAAQFAIAPDVTVSDAFVEDSSVRLVTSALAPATTYTLTVATTVRDLRGSPVDGEHMTATFETAGATGEGRLVINEIDYDIAGAESTEFVELYNGGSAPVSLAGLALVFVNGSGMREYGRVALPDEALAPGAFLVAGTGVTTTARRIDLHTAENAIQNGSPDGVALIDTLGGTLVDALAYEGDMAAVTMDGMTGPVSLVEGTRASAEDINASAGTLCRAPDGADTDHADVDWAFCAMPTPGAPNVR